MYEFIILIAIIGVVYGVQMVIREKYRKRKAEEELREFEEKHPPSDKAK